MRDWFHLPTPTAAHSSFIHYSMLLPLLALVVFILTPRGGEAFAFPTASRTCKQRQHHSGSSTSFLRKLSFAHRLRTWSAPVVHRSIYVVPGNEDDRQVDSGRESGNIRDGSPIGIAVVVTSLILQQVNDKFFDFVPEDVPLFAVVLGTASCAAGVERLLRTRE